MSIQLILLRDLQARVERLYKEREYVASPQTLALGATEEIGEIAMAILLTQCSDFIPSKKKMSLEWAGARDVASEVGDCITYLLALCNSLGIEPTFKWMNENDK